MDNAHWTFIKNVNLTFIVSGTRIQNKTYSFKQCFSFRNFNKIFELEFNFQFESFKVTNSDLNFSIYKLSFFLAWLPTEFVLSALNFWFKFRVSEIDSKLLNQKYSIKTRSKMHAIEHYSEFSKTFFIFFIIWVTNSFIDFD